VGWDSATDQSVRGSQMTSQDEWLATSTGSSQQPGDDNSVANSAMHIVLDTNLTLLSLIINYNIYS